MSEVCRAVTFARGAPSGEIGVRSIATADPAWERFVAEHPHGRIYHHPSWLEVLRAAYGYPCAALAAEDGDGRLTGVLPLVQKRGILTGRRYSSLPHTPICGPLATDVPTTRALLVAAAQPPGSGAPATLQLRTESPAIAELLPGMTCLPRAESYVVDLPDRPEALRFGNSRNHQRVKWAVGKALKAGVTIRDARDERDLRQWYRLYAETLRSHAVPPHAYGFFLAIWRRLRESGSMRLRLAERGGSGDPQLVAGSIFFRFGDTVSYAFSGLRRQAAGLRPNDLLQWQAIHEACEEGFARYDLGAVLASDPGLTTFKRKWGAEPVVRYRCYFPAKRDGGHTELYRETGGRLHTVASELWRRLPVRATTVAGGLLYRYL